MEKLLLLSVSWLIILILTETRVANPDPHCTYHQKFMQDSVCHNSD
jgi:hypothetical protein